MLVMRTSTAWPLPAQPAEAAQKKKSRRSSYRRRRLVVLVVLLLALLGAAVAANYGPLRAYYDARGRVEEAEAQVAALEEKNGELQAELGRLTEAPYLEKLARERLGYARPGEEVYVVEGAEEEQTVQGTETGGANTHSSGAGEVATAPSAKAGFFERLVRAFLDLF